MSAAESRGPSPFREWTISNIRTLTPPETLCLRLLPDDATDTRHGLLEVPRLLRVNQQPKFSLTLLLERPPQPNEDAIQHLVVSGYLGMEISYELPIAAAKQAGAVPLYARRAHLKVEGSSGVTLVELELSTPLLRGAIHLHLNKDDVLSVLGALDRDISTIRLKTLVEFRAAAPCHSISVKLSSVELWDLFQAESPDGNVTEETARRVFHRLLESSGIVLPEGATDRVFRLFLSGCQQFLHEHDGGYTLVKRPALSAHSFQERWNSSIIRSFELDCSLDQVIGGALDGLDREAFVRIVGPSGTVGAGPPLTSLKRVRSRAVRELARPALVALGSKVQTIAATLQPTATSYQTAHLLATETVKPTTVSTSGLSSTYLSQHAVYFDPALLPIKRPRLPVVIDVNSPFFQDEVSLAHRWYLPSVRLVTPAPNIAPAVSPFLFEYERIGSTSSGLPAIHASVRFTLELGLPERTAAELSKLSGVAAKQIEPVEPSVTLTVPYIDAANGRLQRALYRGQVQMAGTRLQVTVDLLNDAVRTTYGSLSKAGFQSEPARLEVSYQFQCLTPVTDRPHILVGGKIAMATFLSSTRQNGAGRIEVGSGSREMVFRVEPERLTGTPDAVTRGAMPTRAKPTAMMTARPPLVLSPAAIMLPPKLQYAQRTMIRQEKVVAFFPCENLGGFYREKSSTGSTAIGCAEAFRLGQASTKSFQEIAELATGAYRIFRNLQQPARFLLLPAFYRITRYAADMGEKAYRPIILAYASLDAEKEENSRILYEAMLAPDITPLAYREVRRHLSAETQNPVLELPNTLAEDVSYHWDLTSNLSVEVTVVRTPDCFDTALATDIPGALLLKNVLQNTGISGEARFKLHDGTLLTSTLSIDLNRITGPWPTGGVQVQRHGRVVTLVNKVERDVTVGDLYVYTGQQAPVRVPVERTIGGGASLEVTGPESFDEAVPDTTFLSNGTVSLEEIRATVEDIRTNAMFVDLVNYENHGLSAILIDARLKGVPGTFRVPMENRRGSVDFLLPITTDLTTMILEYRVTKLFAAKPSETTQWLETSSNVVSITWDQIG